MPLIPVLFNLPPAFLARLDDRRDRWLVGVWWERAGDEVAFTDWFHRLVDADQDVNWELNRQPPVQAWLRDHAINLGNSEQRPSHWLLIDRAGDRAYVCDAISALDHVRTQILGEWAG